ncbi:MAG: hypothetical protein IMY86_07145 [Chloroflexi bacterium]|nr:hypothetical protein [Chloroflexota bacterium]
MSALDEENIGQEKYGARIWGPGKTKEHLEWCDLALMTGTTTTSGTLAQFLDRPKPVIFYGVTVSGAARVLRLERFCPLSR